jgi:glycosyltransferase involved in cell wall biosynthesis
MMNDTHAGTARARGLKMAFKRRIVSSFHAGFVAGAPQKRYFSSLGLSADKIVTGYDAVDNDYFASRTDEVKREAPALRSHYDLPEHYFLNLGRFVAKKNLGTLIRAYRLFLDASERKETHLVLVGSGEEESKLRTLCGELRLPIYDHRPECTFTAFDKSTKVRFSMGWRTPLSCRVFMRSGGWWSTKQWRAVCR